MNGDEHYGHEAHAPRSPRVRHIQDAELLYSPKRDLRRQACRKSEIQYPLCFKFNHLGEALMADIFLSYSQKDAERASRVAATLKRAGWDVWWDANLFAGSSFRREITEQLKSAKCVVVLWSRNANDSTFVPDEAEDGKRRGILVQAILDDVEPPLGFRGIQWADLTSWSGGTEHRGLADLLNGIARHVQRPSIRPQPKQAPVSPAPPKPRSKPLAEQREPIAEAVHPNVISHEVSSASPITKSKGVVTLSPHDMSSIRRSYERTNTIGQAAAILVCLIGAAGVAFLTPSGTPQVIFYLIFAAIAGAAGVAYKLVTGWWPHE